MTTVVKKLEARVGEDLRQPYEAASTVDLSDWVFWELATYVYRNGDVVATLTEGDGTIVRTATGSFYFWLTSAVTIAIARGIYFVQTRRIDAGENIVLHEGVLHLKPYGVP